MKKKKKTEEKKKDFVHTPFGALKGFAADKPETPKKEKESPKPPVKSREDENERDMFLRHVSDVKRLAPEPPEKAKKAAAPPPPAERVSEAEKRLFIESMKQMDVSFQDEIPDVQPLRPVAVNRMRQLKTGAIRIDLELDLHGMSRDESLESLKHFITGAYNRGQKAVLVITGKGNNSPGEPVLQGAVIGWLREQGKTMVAEFAPAPQQLGGAGALVVFLKDKNKVKAK